MSNYKKVVLLVVVCLMIFFLWFIFNQNDNIILENNSTTYSESASSEESSLTTIFESTYEDFFAKVDDHSIGGVFKLNNAFLMVFFQVEAGENSTVWRVVDLENNTYETILDYNSKEDSIESNKGTLSLVEIDNIMPINEAEYYVSLLGGGYAVITEDEVLSISYSEHSSMESFRCSQTGNLFYYDSLAEKIMMEKDNVTSELYSFESSEIVPRSMTVSNDGSTLSFANVTDEYYVNQSTIIDISTVQANIIDHDVMSMPYKFWLEGEYCAVTNLGDNISKIYYGNNLEKIHNVEFPENSTDGELHFNDFPYNLGGDDHHIPAIIEYTENGIRVYRLSIIGKSDNDIYIKTLAESDDIYIKTLAESDDIIYSNMHITNENILFFTEYHQATEDVTLKFIEFEGINANLDPEKPDVVLG